MTVNGTLYILDTKRLGSGMGTGPYLYNLMTNQAKLHNSLFRLHRRHWHIDEYLLFDFRLFRSRFGTCIVGDIAETETGVGVVVGIHAVGIVQHMTQHACRIDLVAMSEGTCSKGTCQDRQRVVRARLVSRQLPCSLAEQILRILKQLAILTLRAPSLICFIQSHSLSCLSIHHHRRCHHASNGS